MKQQLTITEFANTLRDLEAAKHDYLVDTSRLTMEDNATHLRMNSDTPQSFRLRQLAHRQLGDHFNVPAKFYDRLQEKHPDLLAHTMNELMSRERGPRLLRTLHEDARAVLSDRYRPLDNWDLANVVLPILNGVPDMRIESLAVTESRMYIKALFPRLQATLKVGDEVTSGVVISNSEVGLGSLSVEPLVYRLVCLNGMIMATALKKHHLGGRLGASEDTYEVFTNDTKAQTDKAFWMQVQDVVASSVDEVRFRKEVDKIRDAAKDKIEAPIPKVVEVTAAEFKLNETEASSVLTHLASGGDLSRWGLVNAITRASQDVEDYNRATELERLGGQVVELPKNDWERLLAKAA